MLHCTLHVNIVCFCESKEPSHTQHLLTVLDHGFHMEDAQEWGLRLLTHNC